MGGTKRTNELLREPPIDTTEEDEGRTKCSVNTFCAHLFANIMTVFHKALKKKTLKKRSFFSLGKV